MPAIAVNQTFLLATWADVLYACDASWWSKNWDKASEFPGLKVTCSNSVPFRSVHQLHLTGNTGFDPNPMCIRSGGNSGYQATHIAIHGDPDRILLCGVDMTNRDGVHWHGLHQNGLSNPSESHWMATIGRWNALRDAADERGIEIVNCSERSALSCFKRMSLDEALCARSA